jgi:hypothetical protein
VGNSGVRECALDHGLLGSSTSTLDRVMLRLDRINRDPQIAFSVNYLLHTKTLKLTKTLESNKAKSFNKYKLRGSNIQYLALITSH